MNFFVKQVLKTIILKIDEFNTVKTLSLRFNRLSVEMVELVIEWVTGNSSIETLYFHSCGIEDKNKLRLEEAWKKNLSNHKTQCFGYTLIRAYVDPNAPPQAES